MTDRTLSWAASTIDFAVIHTTVDGVIQEWSGAAERILGYTSEEALGMSLSRFFTEDDIRLGLDANEIAVALSQGRSEDDRWHVRKNGSLFWASGVLSSLKRGDDQPLGGNPAVRDVRHVLVQHRDRRHQLAQQAQRRIDVERHVGGFGKAQHLGEAQAGGDVGHQRQRRGRIFQPFDAADAAV